MKYIIIYMAFLLFCYPLQSQTSFSKTINPEGPQEIAIGINFLYNEIDESLIIQSANSCQTTVCAGVCKTDLEGQLVWSSIFSASPYGLGFDDYPGSMIITSTGDIAVCGAQYSSIESDLYDYFLLLVESESGDSLWKKVYPNPEHDLAKSLVQFQDGGYLIGGTNGYYQERDIRLLRTDEDGDIIWVKDYENEAFLSDVRGLKLDDDENIIISGGIMETEESDSDGYIAKLSDIESGEIIQEAFWGTEFDECPVFLDILPDDSGYIGGWCISAELEDPYVSSKNIRKIDNDFSVLWEFEFPEQEGIRKYIYNIKSLADGSILGLGRYGDNDFFYELEEMYDKDFWDMSWLFKLSPDGELEWERVFYDSQFVHFSRIYDVLQLPDGSIYTIGQTVDSLGLVPNSDSSFYYHLYDKNIWLVRFDENGCFNGDCGPDNGGYWDLSGKISVPVMEVKPTKPFVVYPNPSSGIFRLRYEGEVLTYKVLDVSGRLVFEGTGREVDLSDQTLGVYFLQLYEDGVMVGGERIVLL